MSFLEFVSQQVKNELDTYDLEAGDSVSPIQKVRSIPYKSLQNSSPLKQYQSSKNFNLQLHRDQSSPSK